MSENYDRCGNALFLYPSGTGGTVRFVRALWKRESKASFCPKRGKSFGMSCVWTEPECSENAGGDGRRLWDGRGLFWRGRTFFG